MEKEDINFILHQLENNEIEVNEALQKILRLLSSSMISGYEAMPNNMKIQDIDYKYIICFLTARDNSVRNVIDRKNTCMRHFREQFYFLYHRLDGFVSDPKSTYPRYKFDAAGDLYLKIKGKKKGEIKYQDIYMFILNNIDIFYYVSETYRILYDLVRMEQNIDTSAGKKEEFITVCRYAFRNL